MHEPDLVTAFEAYLLEAQAGADGKLEAEPALAERFKVSRGSLREVIMHFQFLGVVERTRNRGSFVRRLAYDKLEEVVSFCFQVSGFGFEELKEARLHLETAILPLIVRRATPEALAGLRENIAQMLLHRNDAETADRLDKEFHLRLFDIGGNRALRVFANILHLLFRRQHRERFLNPAAVRKSAADHARLVEAFGRADLDNARGIIQSHITST